MPTLSLGTHTRVSYDPQTRAVRTWFDTAAEPAGKAPFAPREVARAVLRDNAELFRWAADLPDLRDTTADLGPSGLSVRFSQEFKGVPVDVSEVIVNIFEDGQVYAVINQYHYDIPQDLDPKRIKVKAEQARATVEQALREFEGHEIRGARLIVFQYRPDASHRPKAAPGAPQIARLVAGGGAGLEPAAEAVGRPEDGQYFLAWDLIAVTRQPAANLRFLVDAMTGRLITVLDLAHYATGTTSVFDPNPVVTSGNTGLSWGSAAATLNGERVAANLDRLDAADGGGNLHLDGSYVKMEEFESPVVAEPVSAAGTFSFNFDADGFLDAMSYFHIDRFQNYIQTVLGLTNVANFSIGVDAHGLEGSGDNSHYLPASKRIAFGRRNGAAGGDYNPVPDAADAMVILHEYGHAIQDNIKPGFSGFSGGVGEGFGDFLAAVFYDDKHKTPATTRGIQMSFDANTTDAGWGGRRYDKTTLFDDAAFTGAGGYGRAEVWASVMFELYRKLGGDSKWYPGVKNAARDLAIRLHLMANFQVPVSGSTVQNWGTEILAADGVLGGWRYANGLHKKVIYDTFRRRHLGGFPDLPVDVYINDGRNGGYGSLTGNDAFAENLWLDNFWQTQDLWVKVAPYPDNATQQGGDPGDHVEPPVGSTAYLYVRVRNKGTSGSGPVTVKAFHCMPGMGLVWPDDWATMDTPSIAVADIPAGGKVVVGPFPWTPTEVGHECVLAIAECANDQAITQTLLATDDVAHADLVPFDNNIAQRNLAPTQAKGKTVRGFFIGNPKLEPATVRLQVESTLPHGWEYRLNLANPDAIVLGPRQRRWVEVTIDQAAGAEVIAFDNPPRLTFTGTIDDRVIGGMTFYIAPPSAFAPPRDEHGEICHVKPSDLFCLNIPWKECDVEGEIDIKLRFRCKRQC